MKKIILLMVLIFLSIGGVKAVDENTDLIDKYYGDMLEARKMNGVLTKDDVFWSIDFQDELGFNSAYRLDTDISTRGGMCGLPGDGVGENIKYTNKIGEIYKTFVKRYLIILEKTLKDNGTLTDELKAKIDKLATDVEDSRMNTYKFVYEYEKKAPKIINWFHLNGLEACNAVKSEIYRHSDLYSSGFFDKSSGGEVGPFNISKMVAEFNQSNITNTGVFYSNTMSGNILVLSNKQKITQKFYDYSGVILNIKNSKGNEVDRFYLFPFNALNDNWPIHVDFWPTTIAQTFSTQYFEKNKLPLIDINNFFTLKEKIEMYQMVMNEGSEYNFLGKFSIVKIQGKYFLLARKIDVK